MPCDDRVDVDQPLERRAVEPMVIRSVQREVKEYVFGRQQLYRHALERGIPRSAP